MVWYRKKKSGESYLQLKIGGEFVSFTKQKDVEVSLKEGDIVSCSVVYDRIFYHGRNLKVIDPSVASTQNLPIEPKLKYRHKLNLKAIGWKTINLIMLSIMLLSIVMSILSLLVNIGAVTIPHG